MAGANQRARCGRLFSTRFAQLRAEGEIAIPAGDRARWIAKVNAGTTWTDSFRKLPPSLRFFAGGDRSIRGYGLDDVGPLASNGEVRGGRHLLDVINANNLIYAAPMLDFVPDNIDNFNF